MEPTRNLARVLAASLGAVLLTAVFFTAVLAAPASAGGWSVTTVEEMPAPVVGVESEVVFSVRSHGRVLTDLPPTALGEVQVTAPDGSISSFPVTPTGAPGEASATVWFDHPGAHAWEVSVFGMPQSLGSIDVHPGTVTTSGFQLPAMARYLALALAVGLGALAVADTVTSVRRRPVPA